MLRGIIVVIVLSIFCITGFAQNKDTLVIKYQNSINSYDLRKHLEILSSDAYEGRLTGHFGQKLAAKYLASVYEELGCKPLNSLDYFQKFFLLKDSLSKKKQHLIEDDTLRTENVIAFIEGSDKREEYIILTAHYDHLGKRVTQQYENIEMPNTSGKKYFPVLKDSVIVYNGADDDGSGTVALLEIAEAFAKAKSDGFGPRRSIVFIGFTGEELGLLGSKYYSNNPVVPLASTVANLNIDMIGRVDEEHEGSSNYLYLIGSDRLSKELKEINIQQNEMYGNLNIDFRFDTNDTKRYYYRSDHYNFAKHNVPIVFYFNGTHKDYHKETDEIEKIDFDIYTKRTQYIFSVAWELANREKRILVDKPKDE